jgi:hypothetical protein
LKKKQESISKPFILPVDVQGAAEETHVFNWLVPGKETGEGFRHLLVDSFNCAVSVAMMLWTLQHQVFVFENYIETRSVIAVHHHFCIQFTVERHGNIPDHNTILRWVEAFRATGSVMKRKPPGLPATARIPENVERVRVAVLRSPRHSARRQALALRVSDRSVHHILHKDLKFNLYKIMIVQRLLQGDFAQGRQFL